MQQRLYYLDILKGIAILCIMLLHYEDGVFSPQLNNVIGSFMITAFYVNTAILYTAKDRKNNIRGLCKKRFHQLIIPYLWFSLFIIGFDIILWSAGELDTKFILKDIFYTFSLRGIGTLWFLPVLYVSEVIFVWCGNSLYKWLSVFVGCIVYSIGYELINDINVLLNLNIAEVMITSGLLTIRRIVIGVTILEFSYLLEKKYGEVLHVNKYKSVVYGLLFVIVGILLSCYVNLPIGLDWTRTTIIFLILPYGVSLCLYYSSNSWVNHFFQFYGQNSLIVMATHYSFLLVICSLINKYWITDGSGHIIGISSLVYFAVSVIAEVPIIYLFKQKLKFVIGK